MATQKACTEHLKEWLAAPSMQEAVKAAQETAEEFDGLYDESARNLLARTPDLMLLLSAFQAGRAFGIEEEKKRHQPEQQELGG